MQDPLAVLIEGFLYMEMLSGCNFFLFYDNMEMI